MSPERREAGPEGVDLEAAGLLDGLEGRARESRRELLAALSADGVPLEELRAAVAEDRLAMLPVERVYAPGAGVHTLEEAAELAAVPPALLERSRVALGVRVPEPGERVLGENDLEMARLVRRYLDAGLDEEGVLRASRVIGIAMSQIARAVSQLVVESVVAEGGDESEAALRLASAARVLTPMASETFERAFRAHQLELLRSEAVGSAALAAGDLAGAQEYAICFADLVGSTHLGERLEPDEIGAVADRLAAIAAEVAQPPVRLVKLIGDAAMLSSRETQPLLAAALELGRRADADPDLPSLRIGIARATAVPWAGDLYGRAVNLASRLTEIAHPGSVLCDEATREDAGEGFAYSFAGSRHLKGVEGRVKLFRARVA